jgi:transposase
LEHAPGQRVECDFGHIWVDFPEGRRQVPVLLVIWAYSYCPFVIALPSERTEAILHGSVQAFEFFGCVPKELWWDNPKTVAVTILRGRERRLNERYVVLASHYNFERLKRPPIPTVLNRHSLWCSGDRRTFWRGSRIRRPRGNPLLKIRDHRVRKLARRRHLKVHVA